MAGRDIDDLEFYTDEIDLPPGMRGIPRETILIDDVPARTSAPGTQGTQQTHQMFPRRGPWMGSSELGQLQPFGWDADNRQTILKMSPWGMPTDWTVSLGILSNAEIDDNGDPIDYRVLAEIKYGAGGADQKLVCDWQNGAKIRINGNYVEVNAVYDSVSGGESPDPPKVPYDLKLSAVLATNSGTTIIPVTRSFKFSDPDFSGDAVTTYGWPAGTLRSGIVRIPDFATRMRFIPKKGAVASLTAGYVLLVTEPSNTADVNSTLCRWQADLLGTGFPIPNGARYAFIALLSGAGADDRECFLQFDLEL